jgi:flagellar biosynthesis protein FlhG
MRGLPDLPMRDFYASTDRTPLDQAHGLRQLFAANAGQAGPWLLPLVANPHVAFGGVLLDRAAAALAARGQRVLIVDAAAASPAPSEMAALDLAACVEPLAPGVAYLPARGLPRAHVDTRGSAARFLDVLTQAVPQAGVLLLHAEAPDLARMLQRRAARPLLLAADHAQSLQHAYGSAKLLAQRCQLMTHDLLLAGPVEPARAQRLRETLGSCLDRFIGALLHEMAVIDPAAHTPEADLLQLLAAQQRLQDPDPAPSRRMARAVRSASPAGWPQAAARPGMFTPNRQAPGLVET